MPPRLKRARSPSPPTSMPTHGPNHIDVAQSSPQSQRAKKLKLLASHSIASPFPDFAHPTPSEAAQVHDLLAATHPDLIVRRASDPPSAENNSARTCGKVPNVLESLIGTILSQNTSAKNCTAAKRGLDAAFGRNNFKVIAEARKEEVVQAIKTGGLANKKAGVIQKILRDVHARHGDYSLQHLSNFVSTGMSGLDVAHGEDGKRNVRPKSYGNEASPRGAVTDEEAMQELISYDGVGPKTASCVLLFCLGRASFPVDTHVFRLSRLLGWVPQKADRVTAQAHLDLTIPAELKYGLHVLMVGHGRRCKGCKGTSSGKGECVLKRWLREQKGTEEEELEARVVKAEEEQAASDDDGGDGEPAVKVEAAV